MTNELIMNLVGTAAILYLARCVFGAVLCTARMVKPQVIRRRKLTAVERKKISDGVKRHYQQVKE